MPASCGKSNRLTDQILDIVVKDSAEPQWAELLASDPCSSFFQTEFWISATCAHLSGTKPIFLHAYCDDRLVGGLAAISRYGRSLLPGGLFRVFRIESSLEGTSGGPIVASELDAQHQDQIFTELISAYLNLPRSLLSSLTITLGTGHEKRFAHLMVDDQWYRHENASATIPLDGGIEHVEMFCLKKNKRNERNKGLRCGAEVGLSTDPADLDAYYQILLAACQVWDVKPVPLSFLHELLTSPTEMHGVPSGGFFTCVKVDDQVVGGHINLFYRDTVLAWSGITDPTFARSHFPATLAVWGDLVESCQRGAKYLDMGASDGVVSLQGFKKLFGAVQISRGHYVADTFTIRFLSRLQSLLNKIANASRLATNKQRWHDKPKKSETSDTNS